jgi:hypothetical protein
MIELNPKVEGARILYDQEILEFCIEIKKNWKAREKEKIDGKKGRRESHDAKRPGEGPRSKSRINEDYN